MDLELDGTTVVVTGAASGIGYAIAERFGNENANLVLLDQASDVNQRATEIAAKSGTETRSMELDVTCLESVERAAQFVTDEFGGCQHVICAAGCGSGNYGFPFWNLSPSEWNRVLDVNVMGVVNCAHAFAPVLLRSNLGSMLFIGSVAGQIGSQSDPPYSAAKAAVINFAQCAARDFAEYNIRVNTICPGMIKTPLNRGVWQAWNERQPEPSRKNYEDWAADKISKIAPLNRWQEPDDIAAMAVFLASPRAANITGQTINVDGGQVMHS